jgi:hypothetical protein
MFPSIQSLSFLSFPTELTKVRSNNSQTKVRSLFAGLECSPVYESLELGCGVTRIIVPSEQEQEQEQFAWNKNFRTRTRTSGKNLEEFKLNKNKQEETTETR